MTGSDPVLRELFDRAYREIAEADERAAARHRVVAEELEAATRRRELIQDQYAQLERSVVSANERWVRSERIFVDAMSDISLDMRRNSDRTADAVEESRAHRQTLFAILDRLEELRG